jgi:hypothetical protein
MTGGFDEWVVARTPSLLAFAAVLTEDDERAGAAVSRALLRIRPAWSRVSREDPDLEARRQVIRACSTPRRAAMVLRVLEERSDAEIAEVLCCSESAARRHVQRGVAEVHEQQNAAQAASVRDQLVAQAGSAPTQLLTRTPVAPALDGPRRRRRGAWLAALAVIALVGGVAYVSHESRTPDGVISYPKVGVPESWRYESYAGVQVQVPDTWGWGASPVRADYFDGPRHLGSCGATQAAVLSPMDDAAYVSALTGFVGRPAFLDPRCIDWGAAGSMPGGDAVWFDSPLAAGVKPVVSTVAETRVVGDQHVTVFSDDRDLRREILGTAEQVDVDANGCPTRPVVRPTTGPDRLEPASLSVCVYSQDTGVATLMWSGTVPESAARAYAEAVRGAAHDGLGACPTPTGRWVALGVSGDSGTRWDVANLGCDRIQLAGGGGAPLSRDTVESWAYGGATAYVSAPHGAPELAAYFAAPAG